MKRKLIIFELKYVIIFVCICCTWHAEVTSVQKIKQYVRVLVKAQDNSDY